MKIVFAGTPHFALPCLDALLHSRHEITAVYTQPDRPAGRGHRLQASPVKIWAQKHQLSVHQPLNFKQQIDIDELRALEPDLMIVIAYGLILPQAVLDIPQYGCVNVHASLLPRWRGASPIQQSILHGDTESGITLMQLDAGMDTGPVFTQVPYLITPHETAESLHFQLSQLAATPLINLLDAICARNAHASAQDHTQATHAPKIRKEDAHIDWQKSAQEIDRQIRAFNPWPIAFTFIKEETVRIHQAQVLNVASQEKPGTIIAFDKKGLQVATGHGILLIERVQFSGGKARSIADYLNASGQPLRLHEVLT